MVHRITKKIKLLENTTEIERLVSKSKHLGTSVLRGFDGIKSKTFNLYKIPSGEFLVTNHYGVELVNAMKYKNENDLKKDWKNGIKEFEKYYCPFAP